MVNRDYTQEIGLKSAKRTVPLPIALTILAVVGALVWFGLARLQAGGGSAHGAADAPAAKLAPTGNAHG